MEENLKQFKRKETIMIILLCVLILLFCLVIVIVCVNKESVGVQEQPLIIDENTYVRLINIDNKEEYFSVYKSVNVKKVNFTNVSDNLISDFYVKQDEFINKINSNIVTNKEYIDGYNTDNEITDYEVNSTLDSVVLYDLNDNILSLLYLIEDNVDYIGLNNYIVNIFINVSNNSLVSTDSLLAKYGLDKEKISLEVFNNVVNYHDDKFIIEDTEDEITKDDILAKSDEYVKLLVDNFDSYIYIYFNEGNLYLKYNKSDISNFLFKEKLDTVKYSTLKLEIK